MIRSPYKIVSSLLAKGDNLMKNKKLSVMVILTLIFVLLFASTGANAAANSGAVVFITGDQVAYAADQEVVIHVTISNPTNRPVKVLKWFTPAEDVEEPLFTVLRDGQAVSYMGAIYKRPAPTSADYISLKAGESLSRDVALSAYYDFSVTGTYTVFYNVASVELSGPKGLLPSKNTETLSSNALELKIDGRPAPLQEYVSPEAVSGTTSFVKCTTTQQTTLVTARDEAANYSSGALNYLQAGLQGLRYTTWFGIYNSSRYNTVTAHFDSISDAMDTAPVTFNCGCKKKYYAYVYPNQPYIIYLCRVFWTAPMTGTDSKAGTLIHEMSHFYVVASTDDYVYGQTGAKSLAITDPDLAINNADNHEYFAENTPPLP